MPKIIPHLWYDKEAKEAAALYTTIFPNSKITGTTVLNDTPSGSVDLVTLTLAGQDFMMMSAGPYFKFTPATSFLVACDTKDEVDAIWKQLAAGGQAMMPLEEYPFSAWYGWTTDRFGLSWQVMLMGDIRYEQKITPTLMFTGANAGKAEEAIGFYAKLFPDSKVGNIMRYGGHETPDKEGTVKHAGFTLAGYDLAAMDSAHEHGFTFNEAISLIVNCDDQQEVDRYWTALSAVPEAEQCGWLKDKYGVSWQIIPVAMNKLMREGSPDQVARVTQALLKMKKLDIAQLEKAARG